MFRTNALNDNELVQRFIQGDQGSLETLIHRHKGRVFSYILLIVKNQELAEDIFQETFIKVFENRKSFRGKNFAAWLFTIARHTCLNQLRSKKDFESFDEVFHSSMKSKVPDVALKDYIEYSISKLPVTLREALLLREYEECSYQEIAEILDIELSLAKVRVHRARVILRKLLKPLVKELNESR